MDALEKILSAFAEFVWNWPLAILIVGGGLFFMVSSRAVPFRYLGHAIAILRGRYDRAEDPGQITHFRALSSALAATVGMGNIGGVAVAISTGGPGAMFWMWVSAVVGMATKFHTCTLAVMFRGRDDRGEIQGGPMYFIDEGLGRRFRPLALLFAGAGLIGALPMFQSNQLTENLRNEILLPSGCFGESELLANVAVAIVVMALVTAVTFGGIRRIALVASRLVPSMVVLYMATAAFTLLLHLPEIPGIFALIVRDAFTGKAVVGGAIGSVIITGIRRGAFSNEAGVGTEALAHGAAKTREPVREGLVAMIGPMIDTLVVCNATAFMILATGAWQSATQTTTTREGVTLTARAFDTALPWAGGPILLVCVVCFSLSTMFGYGYYGVKCATYLLGTRGARVYRFFYVLMVGAACVWPLGAVLDLIDGAFAVMAIPTMTASLLLSGRVRAAARAYFGRLARGEFAALGEVSPSAPRPPITGRGDRRSD